VTTVGNVCLKGVDSVCGDTTGGSAGGQPKDIGSSDGDFETWTTCDGDRQMGEVATSTFTTSEVASVATVDLVAEDAA
jgi:hypothetical protein